MSYDAYFWFRATSPPEAVVDALAEEDVSLVEPNPAVAAFRAQLLACLPEWADFIEPPALDPSLASPADSAEYFLALTLPYSESGRLPLAFNLAARHGLTAYDPQTEELRHAH